MVSKGEFPLCAQEGAQTRIRRSSRPSDRVWNVDERVRKIELTHVDGQLVREHRSADALRAAGAHDTPRGLVIRD